MWMEKAGNKDNLSNSEPELIDCGSCVLFFCILILGFQAYFGNTHFLNYTYKKAFKWVRNNFILLGCNSGKSFIKNKKPHIFDCY